MTRDEATKLATRQVMGDRLAEYEAATATHAAGDMHRDVFETIERGYKNTLERRREQIAEATAILLDGPKSAARCAAAYPLDGGAIARCKQPSTTTIGGKPFCSTCAPFVPRQALPEKLRGAAA